MNPKTNRSKTGPIPRRIGALAAVILCSLPLAILLWPRSEAVHGQTHSAFWLRSASFSNGNSIPGRFTCDGVDLSPQLQWQAAPPGTKSFVLVMDDPDAPTDFTHWLVYNIPPDVRELAEGASGRGAMPAGSLEGTNDFGRLGYGGPCPPRGNPHHYLWGMYALDRVLDLPPGATVKRLGAAMVGHIVGKGTIVGTYQRASRY